MVELSNLPSALFFKIRLNNGLVVWWLTENYTPSMNAEVSFRAVAKLEEWFGG